MVQTCELPILLMSHLTGVKYAISALAAEGNKVRPSLGMEQHSWFYFFIQFTTIKIIKKVKLHSKNNACDSI